MLYFIGKIYKNLEEIVCTACLGIMVGCLFLQVFARNIDKKSLSWTTELSHYAFIWAVFTGAALVAKHAQHVRVTAQFIALPLKARLGLRILADAIWVGFSLYIAWTCASVITSLMAFPEISPTLGIEKAYVEFIVPIAFTLMSWRVLEGYILLWRKGRLYDLVTGGSV